MKVDDQDFQHAHAWGPERRRDFCHFVQIERRCRECPAVRLILLEARDFGADPLSIAFADQDCGTCREMLSGLEPESWRAHRENHGQAAENHAR